MASETTKTVGGGGISFCGLLTIVFIVLKLAEIGAVASWSWIWVVSPMWIPLATVLGLCIVGLIIYVLVLVIIATIDHLQSKRPKKRK